MSKCDLCGRYFRKKRSAAQDRELRIEKAKDAVKRGVQTVIK